MGNRVRARIFVALAIATVFYVSVNYRDLLQPTKVKYVSLQSDETLSKINLSSVKVKVLMWTNYHRTDILQILPTKTLLNESRTERTLQCPKSKVVCSFSKAREEVESADAVLFNARDIYFGFQRKENHMFPKARRHDQPWVYFNRESPAYTYLDLRWLPGVFNWTMTYRSDSDIPFPHGMVVKRKTRKSGEFKVELNRANPVAWTVSHCNARSERDNLVKQLSQHIPVDIYGGCGDHKCPEDPSFGCHRYLEKLYKFYLSFENSLCSEYVTEKFFKALNSQMIPVVYGRADYGSLAPPKSFINVKDYNSTQELAEYLLWLDKNPEEYRKYFAWKKDWEVVETDLDGWCGLCEKIAKEKAAGWKVHKWYKDLSTWWFSAVDVNITGQMTIESSNGVVQQRGGIDTSELVPGCVVPNIVKENSH